MRKIVSGLAAASLFVAACALPPRAAAAQAGWGPFWTKFRSAVVKGDRRAVNSLSASPQMPKDYQPLFGTRAAKRCFAAAQATKDEEGGYSVFCGEQGYYFRKVAGQFRFVESFAND